MSTRRTARSLVPWAATFALACETPEAPDPTLAGCALPLQTDGVATGTVTSAVPRDCGPALLGLGSFTEPATDSVTLTTDDGDVTVALSHDGPAVLSTLAPGRVCTVSFDTELLPAPGSLTVRCDNFGFWLGAAGTFDGLTPPDELTLTVLPSDQPPGRTGCTRTTPARIRVTHGERSVEADTPGHLADGDLQLWDGRTQTSDTSRCRDDLEVADGIYADWVLAVAWGE